MRYPTALIIYALSQLVAAQASPPVESDRTKQRDVQAATQSQQDNSAGTQATAAEQARNVRVSKDVPKLSKGAKAQFAKEGVRSNINPENSSGVAATARMQAETTAISRSATRQNAEFKSKPGNRELDAELRQKSTP